jgi:hypothetical protein
MMPEEKSYKLYESYESNQVDLYDLYDSYDLASQTFTTTFDFRGVFGNHGRFSFQNSYVKHP